VGERKGRNQEAEWRRLSRKFSIGNDKPNSTRKKYEILSMSEFSSIAFEKSTKSWSTSLDPQDNLMPDAIISGILEEDRKMVWQDGPSPISLSAAARNENIKNCQC